MSRCEDSWWSFPSTRLNYIHQNLYASSTPINALNLPIHHPHFSICLEIGMFGAIRHVLKLLQWLILPSSVIQVRMHIVIMINCEEKLWKLWIGQKERRVSEWFTILACVISKMHSSVLHDNGFLYRQSLCPRVKLESEEASKLQWLLKFHEVRFYSVKWRNKFRSAIKNPVLNIKSWFVSLVMLRVEIHLIPSTDAKMLM